MRYLGGNDCEKCAQAALLRHWRSSRREYRRQECEFVFLNSFSRHHGSRLSKKDGDRMFQRVNETGSSLVENVEYIFKVESHENHNRKLLKG